jgi:hypothetical protein
MKAPGSIWNEIYSSTAGYTCIIVDKKRNEHIVEELQVEPITTYVQKYIGQWKYTVKAWQAPDGQN